MLTVLLNSDKGVNFLKKLFDSLFNLKF
jgi:hypothetical protein